MRLWFIPCFFLIWCFQRYRAKHFYKKVFAKKWEYNGHKAYRLLASIVKLWQFTFKIQILVHDLKLLPRGATLILVTQTNRWDLMCLLSILLPPIYPGFIIPEALLKSYFLGPFLKIIHAFPFINNTLIGVIEPAQKFLIHERQPLCGFLNKNLPIIQLKNFLIKLICLSRDVHTPISLLQINNQYKVSKNWRFKKMLIEIHISAPFHPASLQNIKIELLVEKILQKCQF